MMPLTRTVAGVLAAAIAAAACGRLPASQPQVVSRACPPESLPATKLALDDGRTVYVEPMAFARNGGTAVLAGEPMYAWSKRDSAPQMSAAHGLLGVTFIGSQVLPLPKPNVAGIVTHVRLAPDGAGFAAVFAVTDSSSVGRYEEKVVSYWAGRTDGRSWSSIEQLPLPPRPLDPHSASQIVAARRELLVAVSFGLGVDESVAIYTRASSGWRLDTLSRSGISYLALVAANQQPILYVVGASTTFGFSNEIYAFRRTGRRWTDAPRLARGSRRPVHDPQSSAHGNSAFLTWVEEGDVSAPGIARVAALDREGNVRAIATLGTHAEDVEAVPGVTETRAWILEGATDTLGTFTLIEWTQGAPVVRDILLNPFRGPSLAASFGDDPVIIGPLFDPSGKEETVVSGILRFRNRCATRVPPGTP